jgi:hypothetical protein
MGLVALALPLYAQTALISTGALWKYFDNGSSPGTTWTTLGFDDSAWASGPAQLGYGDGDEATRLESGPSTNVFLAYYFRHDFNVPVLTGISNLVVRVLRDDGAVVYLNGTEVFRNNMPAGPIDASTPASDIVNSPQESQFYSRRLSPSLLRVGSNILAVEIHQGSTTSSDLSFDLQLLANVQSTAPAVAITSPTNDASYLAPATVLISVAATDFDGIVTNVEFVVDGGVVDHDSGEPYDLGCSNHLAGMHLLQAVATDDAGFASTSAPVRIQILAPPLILDLVTNGSYWRYSDDGSYPGPTWPTAGFADSGWLFNRAQFGFGESDEATTVQPQLTHYFRHKFTVQRAADFTNLLFRVLRDDGVVVYLNGIEAFRMNMPMGPIDHSTPAFAPVGSTNESFYFPTNLPATLLVNGINTLAVELHQTAASNDGSFDLSLAGIGLPGTVLRLRYERNADNILLRWTDPEAKLEVTHLPGFTWATLSNAVSPYPVPPGGSRLFRLRGR